MTEVDDHCDNNVNVIEEDDRENCSLFLGDLSIFCEEKDIEEAFAQFGEIVDVRIQRSKETSRALSYGFIEFAEAACAEAALNAMNYYLLKGRPLRIRWAASRKNPVKSTATPHDSAATVYVRFMSQSGDAAVSEETLRELFNNYGPVFDCAIKKLSQDPKTNRTKGYAFVSFDSGALIHGGVDVAGVDAAYRASVDLRNRVVNNVRYRCELGYRLHKQYAQLTQQACYAQQQQQAPQQEAMQMSVPMPPMPVPVAVPGMVPVMSQGYAPEYQQNYAAAQYSGNYQQQEAQAGGYGQQDGNAQRPQAQQQQVQYMPQQMQYAAAQQPLQQQQVQGQQEQAHSQAPQQQQIPYAPYQPAYAQYQSMASNSFSPTHMVSQILGSNRSPTNYEMQLLQAMTPRNAVPVQAQAQPAGMYGSAYMPAQAVQQQGYATSVPLTTTAMMVTPTHHAQQQYLAAQAQAQAQQPQMAPQYMYQYYSSANSTPTHANPEMGLRALQAMQSRSVSSDSAMSFTSQPTASMVMQMPMMMVPVPQPGQMSQPQGGLPQLTPINTSRGYVQVVSPTPYQQQQAAQQPQQLSPQPLQVQMPQQGSPNQAQQQSGPPSVGKAYAPPTPRGSCSEYFNQTIGLDLRVSTDPLQHMEQPAVLVQHLNGSREATPKSLYSTRKSTPSARRTLYDNRSPSHMQMIMAQQLHMQQALVQQMHMVNGYQDPTRRPASRRGSSDSNVTTSLYMHSPTSTEHDGTAVRASSESGDVMMQTTEVTAAN